MILTINVIGNYNKNLKIKDLESLEKNPKDWSWKDFISSFFWGPLILIQFIQSFFVYNFLNIDLLCLLGWIIWIFSLFFGFMPFYEFKKKGGVTKGDSYIKTTKLVDTGIYAIVRHGQYLAGILWSFALILITQHWFNLLCGIPVMIGIYYDMFRADKELIMKFGDNYMDYMKKVPRANFIWGIVKYLYRKR